MLTQFTIIVVFPCFSRVFSHFVWWFFLGGVGAMYLADSSPANQEEENYGAPAYKRFANVKQKQYFNRKCLQACRDARSPDLPVERPQ